jgi:hypothetical protein
MADEAAETVVDTGELQRRSQAWAKQAAAFEAQAAALQARVAELEPLAAKVAELEPVAKSAAELRAAFDALQIETQTERGLRAVGVAADDARAAALVKHWRREQAELPDDKRAGFDAWITASRESDPVVASLTRPANATTGAVGSTSTGQAQEPPRAAEDIGHLTRQHAEAIKAGDFKGARELLAKIRATKA